MSKFTLIEGKVTAAKPRYSDTVLTVSEKAGGSQHLTIPAMPSVAVGDEVKIGYANTTNFLLRKKHMVYFSNVTQGYEAETSLMPDMARSAILSLIALVPLVVWALANHGNAAGVLFGIAFFGIFAGASMIEAGGLRKEVRDAATAQ